MPKGCPDPFTCWEGLSKKTKNNSRFLWLFQKLLLSLQLNNGTGYLFCIPPRNRVLPA